MTTIELMRLMGKNGSLLTAEGLRVEVQIVDVKVSYGSVRVKVTPVAGACTAWVDKSRVTTMKDLANETKS